MTEPLSDEQTMTQVVEAARQIVLAARLNDVTGGFLFEACNDQGRPPYRGRVDMSFAVPHDVELGIHLCYGDFEAKHFIEPRDAGKMVELANALAKTIDHPLAFIHMPVPVERNDDGFFKPFENMQLDGKTEVYLGLVHAKDGAEGTRKRIATASKYVPRFGIACECGIARARRPELVRSLLAIHAESTREPT